MPRCWCQDRSAACYLLLAMLLYVRTDDRTPMARTVLTGVVLGVAYLTKEPAAFVALALLVDSALARRWRQTVGIALGIGAMVALNMPITSGLPVTCCFDSTRWRRITALRGCSGPRGLRLRPAKPVDDVVDHAPSAVGQHARWQAQSRYRSRGGLSRTTSRPATKERIPPPRRPLPSAFINYPQRIDEPSEDFGIHSLAALILAAAAFLRFRHDHRTRLLLLWAAVPWLYSNFGTTSFVGSSRFQPLCATLIRAIRRSSCLAAGCSVAAAHRVRSSPLSMRRKSDCT